MFHRAFETDIN